MPRDTPIKKPRVLDIGDRIGASFGVTLNMGDFQSLRVEFWAESAKREGETSEEAATRLFKFVEEQANLKANEYPHK